MSYDYSENILVQEAAENLLRDCLLPKLMRGEIEVNNTIMFFHYRHRYRYKTLKTRDWITKHTSAFSIDNSVYGTK